jgi:hypothetical protein
MGVADHPHFGQGVADWPATPHGVVRPPHGRKKKKNKKKN